MSRHTILFTTDPALSNKELAQVYEQSTKAVQQEEEQVTPRAQRITPKTQRAKKMAVSPVKARPSVTESSKTDSFKESDINEILSIAMGGFGRDPSSSKLDSVDEILSPSKLDSVENLLSSSKLDSVEEFGEEAISEKDLKALISYFRQVRLREGLVREEVAMKHPSGLENGQIKQESSDIRGHRLYVQRLYQVDNEPQQSVVRTLGRMKVEDKRQHHQEVMDRPNRRRKRRGQN